MGRAPCCDKNGLKKGPWTPEEDQKLIDYIQQHGHGSWRTLPKHAGLLRCGKSCRLRWTNYLRPDIKRGKFSFEEEQTIIQLHAVMGNKWSAIAAHLPGRTDNEIKNYWNTHLKKRLLQMGIDPVTHRPRMDLFNFSSMSMGPMMMPPPLNHMAAQWENARLEAIVREYLRVVASSPSNNNIMNADNLSSLFRNHPPSENLASLLEQANIASQGHGNAMFPYDSNTMSSQLSHLMNNTSQYPPNQFPPNYPIPSGSSPTSTNSSFDGLNPQSVPSLLNAAPAEHQGAVYNNVDGGALWPSEEQILGFLKNNSESVPPLMSSTSSPNMIRDPDLMHKNISPAVANDYAVASSDIFIDFSADKANDKYDISSQVQVPQTQTSASGCGSASSSWDSDAQKLEEEEDARDYWQNMLKLVDENIAQ